MTDINTEWTEEDEQRYQAAIAAEVAERLANPEAECPNCGEPCCLSRQCL